MRFENHNYAILQSKARDLKNQKLLKDQLEVHKKHLFDQQHLSIFR